MSFQAIYGIVMANILQANVEHENERRLMEAGVRNDSELVALREQVKALQERVSVLEQAVARNGPLSAPTLVKADGKYYVPGYCIEIQPHA